MTRDTEKTTATDGRVRGRRRLGPQLAIELLIGMAIAVLLIAVGWASSNAIRFVYGGY